MDFNFMKQPPESALDVESEFWLDFVINSAKKSHWNIIYLLSNYVSREVSILVDSKNNHFVDWGTIGSVELSPPIGAVLPFKLWVHTHPSNTAYWSVTDRNTLEMAKGILEKALVLGENGLLSTTLQATNSFTGDDDNSKSQWTVEEVMGWLEYNRDNLDNDFADNLDSLGFANKWFGRKVFNDTFDSDGKDW